MNNNPSKFQEGWSAGLRPVETVSFDDVQVFSKDSTTSKKSTSASKDIGDFHLNPNGNMFRKQEPTRDGLWQQRLRT